MSMLSCLFDIKNNEENRELFNGLKIEKSLYCSKHMGQCPDIFLSFKQVKSKSWDLALDKIKGIILQKYIEKNFLLASNKLEKEDKQYFKRILNRESSIDDIEESLGNLSRFLLIHYDKKTIILVDDMIHL